MRTLLVGDMHVTPSEVTELEPLMKLIVQSAKKHEVKRIIFLGDQHHTHSVIHSEVIKFWDDWINVLEDKGFALTFIIGNHDQSLKDPYQHPFVAYRGNSCYRDIIESFDSRESIGFISYSKDEGLFLNSCNVLNERGCNSVVFCHQTFKDAVFENGQLAPEGFDSSKVPQTFIISGHIHKAQKIGKVWYPGTPRWRTLSDANELEKYIYVVDMTDHGYSLVEAVPTSGVVKRIISIEETENSLSGVQLNERDDVRVLLKGTKSWVNSRKEYWSSRNVKIRTVITGRPHKVKESIGIDKAFQGFLGQFKAPNGTDLSYLSQIAQKRLQYG